MLALGRFLQQQAQDEAGDQYVDLLERLVQRVSDAVLLPDRREALQQLRDLLLGSPKAQLAFGAVGFPAMLQVVRDRDDGEMVQLALESLAAAVAVGSEARTTQAVAVNAQQLARMPDAMPLLLNLLEQGPAGVPDFYARYYTLQVLKGLASAAPHHLQEAILGTPLGVTRLMELLGEQEVLRNEALLLLTQLAAGSSDLQKIAAFEGAFDRLFGIIREEGMLNGDIVVQDCFQLLATLLRGSPPNQLMFRETGFLAQLPVILQLSEDGSRQLPSQKGANLVAAMEVVLALLPPPAGGPMTPICSCQAENRQALLHRGLLDVLIGLALQAGGALDDTVRAQALLCLAALISGSLLQQDQLAEVSVKSASGEVVPLLQAVLQVAVSAQSAAEQVQLQTQQQQQQWRQLGHTNSSASSLIALCTSHLGLLVTHYGQQPVSVRAAANILRLLLLWLHGCPPAVTAFLRAVAHSQPFLVDSIRGSNACSTSASSSNPLTRSMLALLLGLCALYAEDAAGTPSQQQLLTAIDKQIGQEQYLSILDSLQHQPAVKDSSSSGSIFGEEPSISPAFAACLAMLAAEVRKSVTGDAQLRLTAEALQRENQQLRTELASMTERLRCATGNGTASQAALEAQAAAEAQADVLRQQLVVAQQQLLEVQAEVERARADMTAGQVAARKLEMDLQDLSAAYSTLDAHADSLQQQVDQLQCDLAGARQRQDDVEVVGAGAQQGGTSQIELQQRLEAVRQEAQQEADDAMADLLACLGMEEAKVARLRERLQAYGVDCDALLADIVVAGEEEDVLQ
ncbi:hypothetical protein CHLNCDRAFT_140241 [Chlorella variabilis]|uniref:Vesicle tethering protein Uso1/P115-like head domain-containing protein n=1 Tax=Chlorella variabilis TaxID=554065 RepID=E1ZRV6_CHLVA|nr:hypothetical protein CHLNCDRAFT_140241 [Chlorella variabilis]EFN51480.1 hypothetical protein CHLNCDRAFT_140241 [Chlorella variabilis]|eukprot:XP_005843582.1 hypothetical protein CHLNCDRAFT_140241 [Chlorella variabilis]